MLKKLLWNQGRSPCEFTHDLYTSLKSMDPGLCFCCWWIYLYLLTYLFISLLLHSEPQKKLDRVRRCITVVQNHQNWYQLKAHVFNFLLLYLCSYMPMFYSLRYITIYWSKISVFCRFYQSQSHLKTSQGMFSSAPPIPPPYLPSSPHCYTATGPIALRRIWSSSHCKLFNGDRGVQMYFCDILSPGNVSHGNNIVSFCEDQNVETNEKKVDRRMYGKEIPECKQLCNERTIWLLRNMYFRHFSW